MLFYVIFEVFNPKSKFKHFSLKVFTHFLYMFLSLVFSTKVLEGISLWNQTFAISFCPQDVYSIFWLYLSINNFFIVLLWMRKSVFNKAEDEDKEEQFSLLFISEKIASKDFCNFFLYVLDFHLQICFAHSIIDNC